MEITTRGIGVGGMSGVKQKQQETVRERERIVALDTVS